ncbi:MAG: PTS IIA-like nitrogen regulatory protein PtsN [Halioglobus sp.]|nr:PTS IIA-like nitrogen regulatory protein PtsN [Halioglobus sp.]
MQALSEILSPARTASQVQGTSKKRLFETIARIVCDDQGDLDYNDVLDKLIAREELGSTGLGEGIAIPHCRVGNCQSPLGTLLTLAEPIPFDAPDDKPVDLLFVLLVPEEAHQAHLDILAQVARAFSEADYCAQLREATGNDALYRAALGDTQV